MKRLFRYFLQLIFFFLFPALAFAQAENSTIEMADLMRSNGKIYVVVAVLLVIFLGLAIFLFSIDRKVSKLEGRKK